MASEDISITEASFQSLAGKVQAFTGTLPADEQILFSAILNLAGQRLSEPLTEEVAGFAFVPIAPGYIRNFTPFSPRNPTLPEGFSNLPAVVQAGTLEEMGLVEPGTSARLMRT